MVTKATIVPRIAAPITTGSDNPPARVSVHANPAVTAVMASRIIVLTAVPWTVITVPRRSAAAQSSWIVPWNAGLEVVIGETLRKGEIAPSPGRRGGLHRGAECRHTSIVVVP